LNFRDLGQLIRPWQWSKNGILFAGLIFSENLFHPDYLQRSFLAFIIFCLASSAVYVVNDLLDVERDRLHPEKRNRPIAAGRVGRGQAVGMFLILIAVALGLGTLLGTLFLLCLALFIVVNVAYSLWLKNIVILDVMAIAISFVIRAVAGVMALRPLDPDLELSSWLLVCTLFLALFLALGKRRNELVVLEGDAANHRVTLSEYSPSFLDQLMSIVTAATVIAYAIYTIAPGTLSKFHSPALVITIPFVVYGIFRYLFLIQERGEGGRPSRTLYQDIPILLTTVGWLAMVVLVIYAHAL